jgi:DDE superfamily endonuclease
VLAVVHRAPRTLGIERTRWTLAAIREAAPWLTLHTDGGLAHLLDRLDIHWKRGRDHVHSPDPDYEAKLACRDAAMAAARESGGRIVTLLEDELTIYRQPTLSWAYEAAGAVQPVAERSYAANTRTRLGGVLDVTDGRVLFCRRSQLGVEGTVRFYQQIVAAYPQAARINLVEDNWPVHFHPDVLVALEPQTTPFRLHQLSWGPDPSAEAKERWGQLSLPIQIVPLPTYAPWTNPIEKLWRWLYQDVLHLHRWADDLATLRQQIDAFLTTFAHGSQELLRYVGLEVPA